jgi:hypothetical protein
MEKGSNVVQLVTKRNGNDDKAKLVQFIIVLHLLMAGKSITNFESLKAL